MVFGQWNMLIDSLIQLSLVQIFSDVLFIELLTLFDTDLFQVAPFHTFYSHLYEHMTEVSIMPTIKRWNKSLALEDNILYYFLLELS